MAVAEEADEVDRAMTAEQIARVRSVISEMRVHYQSDDERVFVGPEDVSPLARDWINLFAEVAGLQLAHVQQTYGVGALAVLDAVTDRLVELES